MTKNKEVLQCQGKAGFKESHRSPPPPSGEFASGPGQVGLTEDTAELL